MGANSLISWTDHTWNGWIGCTKVSTQAAGGGACDFCYAERDFDHRHHMAKWGAGQPRHLTKTWGEPLRWNRQAEAFRAKHGHWPRVFANSLSDIADSEVPMDWHLEAHDVIAETKNLRWMLTTKRLPNIPKLFPPDFFRNNPHVGIIVSICNQMEADRDVPRLLELKVILGITWVGLSCEPLLGPIDLSRWTTDPARYLEYCDAVGGSQPKGIKYLDWVICGGESGPHARPMHPDWPRGLRDQCTAAGIAFHHKQNGEFIEVDGPRCRAVTGDHKLDDFYLDRDGKPGPSWANAWGFSKMRRAGRGAAGRLLDGKEWNQFPPALMAA